MHQRRLKSLKLTRKSNVIIRTTWLIAMFGLQNEGGSFKGKITRYNSKMESLKIYHKEDVSGDHVTVEL